MAQDVVINGTTYPAVESVALTDTNGNTKQYYPDAVRYVQQTLDDREKKQALVNINAADLDYVNEIGDRVGALERGKYVLYSSQTLTDGEKQTARQNIGAAPSSLADNVVLLTAQTLSTNQAMQVRKNIGVPANNELTIIGVDADGTQHTFIVCGYKQGGGSNEPE